MGRAMVTPVSMVSDWMHTGRGRGERNDVEGRKCVGEEREMMLEGREKVCWRGERNDVGEEREMMLEGREKMCWGGERNDVGGERESVLERREK